ncbi:hypothetical protein AAE478_000558 [Parahypoxylon ruwenzoriense]
MDYQSIHGQDISSFDLTSTHRLPTVSAAQALEDLAADPRRFISTNLSALDQALNDVIDGSSSALPRPGGLQKGQVVEIWGPPGSGKTTFGIQLAANALRQGEKVVWHSTADRDVLHFPRDQGIDAVHRRVPSDITKQATRRDRIRPESVINGNRTTFDNREN